MNRETLPDLRRLLLVLGAALVLGLLLGHPFALLLLGLLGYVLWQYRALAGFLAYARHGAEDRLLDLPGITNDLVREFEMMRDAHAQWEQKLNVYLQRFEEATEALPDAVVVVNDSGTIEWANPRARDYLGIEWPRDAGQRLVNLLRYPELTAYLQARAGRPREKVLELQSPVDPGRRLELRINLYGGAQLLLMARDITELYRINRMRKDFIANASHELRTPLTVIAGYLEAFEGDTANCPPDWQPRIAQMREQSARMQRLIEDLLELSRLESAGEMEHGEQVAVADMLESILREAQSLSGGRHEFTQDLDPGLGLHGDRHDLYKAFSNIIFNAVQYTPAGGRITVRWYRDADGAHLAVRDTG